MVVMSLVSTASTVCESPSACMIVRSSAICILSGDGDWQVRDVDVEEKGCHDRSLWDAVLRRRNLLRMSEAAMANHLHDHADHVSSR